MHKNRDLKFYLSTGNIFLTFFYFSENKKRQSKVKLIFTTYYYKTKIIVGLKKKNIQRSAKVCKKSFNLCSIFLTWST